MSSQRIASSTGLDPLPRSANTTLGRVNALTFAWASAWNLPDLPASTQVSFSRRIRSTLGRCRPSEGKIVLRADLLDAPPAILARVLCHELAHVAAAQIFGPDVQPHGVEWQSLVRAAGFSPRVRDRSPGHAQQPLHRPRATVEHRCPVCQSVRMATCAHSSWRCAECFDLGLDGALVITRWKGDS